MALLKITTNTSGGMQHKASWSDRPHMPWSIAYSVTSLRGTKGITQGRNSSSPSKVFAVTKQFFKFKAT
jgi:hypothetical protein